MSDLLHLLNLREAYRTGIIDRAEFVRRFAEAMKEAANDR
jgi:hypothetical protein